MAAALAEACGDSGMIESSEIMTTTTIISEIALNAAQMDTTTPPSTPTIATINEDGATVLDKVSAQSVEVVDGAGTRDEGITGAGYNMPPWKKELIQRRKINVARTIGANQSGTCSKKATNVPTSPVIPTTKTLGNGKNSNQSTSQSANVKVPDTNQSNTSAGSGHYTPANNFQQPQVACAVNTSPTSPFSGRPKSVGAINSSSPNSFAGNDGGIISCNGGGGTSGTCLTTSQSLLRQQQLDSIGQQLQSVQLHSRLDIERSEPSETCGIAPGATISPPCLPFIKNPSVNKSNIPNKYKPSAKSLVVPGSNVNSVSANVNNKKMVAAQELSDAANDAFDFDPSEELQYGPGIVSKLRCRYLSLALRQSAGKQRPALDNLRRATSLNNLLDDDDRASNSSSCVTDCNTNSSTRTNSSLNKSPDEFVATFQKNLKITEKDKQRSRHVKRGNDSLKRARSVEALLVSDKSWDTDATSGVQLRENDSEDTYAKNELSSICATTEVTIEDKICNARERISLNEKPPKRLSSFMDDTERPPPDVVKQTLKIFEATANRRGRGLSRNNFSGEVAAKVANYKSIISQEKPPIIYPKPPLSPKKNFRKPGNLDITAAKKINTQTVISSKKTHPVSPISNLAKRFASSDVSIEPIEKQSPQSSSPPIPALRTDISLRHCPKNESTPIRNPYENNSPRTPDIIPRKNLETALGVPVDSPVTQLAKKIERLSIDSPAPNVQQKSSESDDSIDGEVLTKRISKSALENISKAGTTQQFSFNKTNNKPPLAATVNGTISSSSSTSSGNSTAEQQQLQQNSKQVGVIRPLLAEPKLQTDKIKQQQQQLQQPIADVPLDYSTIDELNAKTRDNLVISNLSQSNTNNISNSSCSSSNNSCKTSSPPSDKPALTSREIEKNLINEKKNEQASMEANGAKWQFSKKKSWTQQQTPSQNNSMVFNFKDRKEVPDYIENDGLLFKRKRELPKPNESGFVLLGDLSLETSTDPDDDWNMGPPSPCDVEFENANIIIDGKSSLRYKSKDISLKVQFDDTLTSTFEYPSETSLLDDSTTENANTESTGHINVEEIMKNPGQKLLGSMSLGSAPLGSYTPMKALINTNFELGVTRAPILNTSEQQSADIIKNSNGNSNDPAETLTTTTTKNHNNSNGVNNCLQNGGGGGGGTDAPESLQYLKPATDDLTVVYSEGTQKTDLLY